MRSSLLIAAAVLSVGAISVAWCADEPAPATPAATAQSLAAAPPTAAAHAATGAVTAAAATPSADAKEPVAKPGSGKDPGTEQQMRQLLARGYKSETRNGTTRYCRTEPQLGTRFESKHCGTAEELDVAAQRGQDFFNSIKNYGLPKGTPP